MQRLISWNVNGVRAAVRKGMLQWLKHSKPDILCLQEIRTDEDNFPAELKELKDYHLTINSAQKKGYSGTATLSKEKPLTVERGIGVEKFDTEGRTLITEFQEYYLINTYFPNAQPDLRRLDFKQEFNAAYLKFLNKLRKKKKPVIFTGDFNVAHQPIDIARPKENERSAGYTREERKFIDQLIKNDYIDTFRHLYPETIKYSWWSYRTAARERNVGWRIDYFFTHQDDLKIIKDAKILNEVEGSDHCPVELVIK